MSSHHHKNIQAKENISKVDGSAVVAMCGGVDETAMFFRAMKEGARL